MTKELQKPDNWYKERQSGIWASMLPAILESSEYKDNTKEKLFYDYISGFDQSQPCEGVLARGNQLEYIIRNDIYPQLTGEKLEYNPNGYTSKDYPWLHAHLDGYIIIDGKLHVWECKTYNNDSFERVRTNSLLNDTIIQVHGEMIAAETDICRVTVFNVEQWKCLRNREGLPYITVRRNEALVKKIVEYSKRFLESLEKKTVPSYKVEGVSITKPMIVNTGKLVGNELDEMVAEYLSLNREVNDLNSRKDAIKDKVMKLARDYDRIVFDSGRYATISRYKDKVEIDLERLLSKLARLKIAHPELASIPELLNHDDCKVVKPGSTTIRFYPPSKKGLA